MELLSIILVVSFAGILIFTAAFMVYAIYMNIKSGDSFRQQLAVKISRLRLNRMLSTLGINQAKYLHQESTVDIEQHIKSCNDCDNTEDCDQAMSKGGIRSGNISYCRNQKDLQKVLRKQRRAC